MRLTSLPSRRLALLVVAGLIGVFAVLPHPLDHLAEFFGGGILVAIAATSGTRFAMRLGLGTPFIDAALTAQPFARRALSVAAVAIGLGIVMTLAVIALDTAIFSPLLAQAQVTSAKSPPLWTGALYALYGGLTEETVLHYGGMTLIVWLLMKSIPGQAAYWVAIVLSALVLGLVHLPTTATSLSLAPVVVTRVVVLNLIAGLPFGWLYWRRGLEAAMVSHGVASLVLHVGAPGILG